MTDPTTLPRRRSPRLPVAAVLVFAALGAAGASRAAEPAAAPKAPASWQDAERMTPDELARLLKGPAAERPAVFHVGFRVLFSQAHIPGSRFAGPGASPAGLDALRRAVAPLPKSKTIVLYCGCCPWERCPNLEQPWRALVSAGFTRVKVLYIPTNFGRDWVDKGYPAEAGEPGRG